MQYTNPRLRLTLALQQVRGVGAVTARGSLQAMPECPQTAESLTCALKAAKQFVRRSIQTSVEELRMAFDCADRILEECARVGVGLAIEGDSVIWSGVWKIPNPPLILFYMGRGTPAVAIPGVAVIGTREPSGHGLEIGRQVAMICANSGLPVVSGLAVGCDLAAHRGAIDVGGATLAVLAHGLHTVFPKQNQELAQEIVQSGGLLVTEYAPGINLRPHQLVRRDRLQSGLSRGVIVIETDLRGGSMHTVRFARAQGRPIACINYPSAMREAAVRRGNRQLIQSNDVMALDSEESISTFLARLQRTSHAVEVSITPSGHQVQQEFKYDEPTST